MILLKLELKSLFEIKHGQERRYKKYIVFVQLRGVHLLLARVIVERKEKKNDRRKGRKKVRRPQTTLVSTPIIHPESPKHLAQA